MGLDLNVHRVLAGRVLAVATDPELLATYFQSHNNTAPLLLAVTKNLIRGLTFRCLAEQAPAKRIAERCALARAVALRRLNVLVVSLYQDKSSNE